jgi:hypothetical protein
LSGSGPDVAAWARDHEAAFEVEPLVEMVGGKRTHVGFTLRLFARLPMEDRTPAERRAAGAEIQARLREVLSSLAPAKDARGRLEIEPARAAAFLDPEGGREPEVSVSARLFHGEDYFAEVTEGEEKRVYAGARRLAEMGFKERRPRRP